MAMRVKIVQHHSGRKMETVGWGADRRTAETIVDALHALFKAREEEFPHFSVIIGDFLRYSSLTPEEMEKAKGPASGTARIDTP